MKSLIKITIAIVCIPILVLTFFSLPWIFIGVGVWLSPDPLKPEIRYGEFPFEIVYKLDGQLYTLNDVLVCEYGGINANEGVGKYNSWKGYLKSTGDEAIVLLRKNNVRIICTISSPDYYMNDPACLFQEIVPSLVLIQDDKSITSAHDLSEEECQAYGIELISWTLSEPIQNNLTKNLPPMVVHTIGGDSTMGEKQLPIISTV